MKYYVTCKIDARYVVEVTADSTEDAKVKANLEVIGEDFGAASAIDWEPIIIEDEDGNFVWEKRERSFL